MSAEPGTTDVATEAPKKRKGRGPDTREQYPIPENGLLEVPGDWNSAKHKPLRRGDFEDECVFLEWRASGLEAQAGKLRKEAAQLKAIGNLQERKRARNLVRMMTRAAELQKQLESEGIDVAALMAGAK